MRFKICFSVKGVAADFWIFVVGTQSGRGQFSKGDQARMKLWLILMFLIKLDLKRYFPTTVFYIIPVVHPIVPLPSRDHEVIRRDGTSLLREKLNKLTNLYYLVQQVSVFNFEQT